MLKDDKASALSKAKEALQQSDENLLRDIFHQRDIAFSKNDPSQINLTLAYFSTLLIKLSRQAEKSTKKIICLTYALFGLTFVLLVVAIIQIIIFKQDANTNTHNTQTQQYHQQPQTENKSVHSTQTLPPKEPIGNTRHK